MSELLRKRRFSLERLKFLIKGEDFYAHYERILDRASKAQLTRFANII
ncbi:MAG: hypothetical protein NZ822_01035 [Patescibacteria group bacterium]|nr:hypothetical protein [Patescibacteria group bacterium]